MSDAIGRTLGRLYLTRRRLLEWTTAAQAKSDMSREITGVYRRMRGAPILAVAGGGARGAGAAGQRRGRRAVPRALGPLAPRGPMGEPAASPVADTTPSPADARTLRSTARRTWRFFEAFVGPADHDLPPDNFQEDPKPVVAHRTSPTNIGLYLLSTVAARDFGWLGSLDMLARLEATLETMGRLERFRGHFYNWYDTGDLRPLEPRYVSTVDSGNLAGHLLVLGNACASAIHRPLLDPDAFAGIEDALLLVGEAASALGDGRSTQTVTLGQLDESRQALAAALREPPTSPAAWAARLRQLAVPRRHPRGHRAHTDRGARGRRARRLLAWAEATRAAIASHERVF